MSYKWPLGTRYRKVALSVQDRTCQICGGRTFIKDHKSRRVWSLDAALKIDSEMTICGDPTCPGHHALFTAEQELQIAPPWWILGWDVFAHLGQRRFSKSWSVPEIRDDLCESYGIEVSEDCIEDYIGRYQAILAARQSDWQVLAAAYKKIPALILTIDGLQPEKGHETLYTVREVNARRVWFAEPLVSSSAGEVAKLLDKARYFAKRLGKPVQAWISDKQNAFVEGIASLFPGKPHRYCQNHFLRDLAEPVLAVDSEMKVEMRKKVRGLREVERDILEERGDRESSPTPKEDSPSAAVFDYCTAVRGILNRNQGGPLDPPGLRMSEALYEVRESIQQSLDAGVEAKNAKRLERLGACIDRGMDAVEGMAPKIRLYVQELKLVQETLEPENGKSAKRKVAFKQLLKNLRETQDPIRVEMAGLMERWEPGLFAGGDKLASVHDNLDLERWFRLPKSHQRRIHGHKHAGTSIVEEGPSLVLALDAHAAHKQPFSIEELTPYLGAKPTEPELAAIERRKVMRRARSRKQLPKLLGELQTRVRRRDAHP